MFLFDDPAMEAEQVPETSPEVVPADTPDGEEAAPMEAVLTLGGTSAVVAVRPEDATQAEYDGFFTMAGREGLGPPLEPEKQVELEEELAFSDALESELAARLAEVDRNRIARLELEEDAAHCASQAQNPAVEETAREKAAVEWQRAMRLTGRLRTRPRRNPLSALSGRLGRRTRRDPQRPISWRKVAWSALWLAGPGSVVLLFFHLFAR